METNATWNPEKRELSCDTLDEFLHHQILLHEAYNDAKRGTPLEKSDEFKATKALITELKNIRWKVSKIFVDEIKKPTTLPKKKTKELATA